MKKKLLALLLLAALAVSSLSVAYASGSSTNDRDYDDSDDDYKSTKETYTPTNSRGEKVKTETRTSNGVTYTTSTIGDSGVSVTEAVSTDKNGNITIVRTSTGADGLIIDGMPILSATVYLVKNADGTTVGCFMDANGNRIATGKDEIYAELNIKGEVVLHYVDPDGYFYSGTKVINGHTYTFNEEGVIIAW